MWKAPCTRLGKCHAHDADSWLSMLQPTLNGISLGGASGRDAEGSLYEAAKVHGNREAAAECAAKAEEAIAAHDFDKAVCCCPCHYAYATRLQQGSFCMPLPEPKLTSEICTTALKHMPLRGCGVSCEAEGCLCAGEALCQSREAGAWRVQGGCRQGARGAGRVRSIRR